MHVRNNSIEVMLDYSTSTQIKESGFKVDHMLGFMYLSGGGSTGV